MVSCAVPPKIKMAGNAALSTATGADAEARLIAAAAAGEPAVVAALVVDARNPQGQRALTAAAGNGHVGTASLLLDRGADIEATGT